MTNIQLSHLLGPSLRVSQQLCWSRKPLTLHLVFNLCCIWLHACCCHPHMLPLRRSLPRLLRLLSRLQQSNSQAYNVELNLHSIQHWACNRRRHCRRHVAFLSVQVDSEKSNWDRGLDSRQSHLSKKSDYEGGAGSW